MLRNTNSLEIGVIPTGVFSYLKALKIVTSTVNGAMSLLSVCAKQAGLAWIMSIDIHRWFYLIDSVSANLAYILLIKDYLGIEKYLE